MSSVGPTGQVNNLSRMVYLVKRFFTKKARVIVWRIVAIVVRMPPGVQRVSRRVLDGQEAAEKSGGTVWRRGRQRVGRRCVSGGCGGIGIFRVARRWRWVSRTRRAVRRALSEWDGAQRQEAERPEGLLVDRRAVSGRRTHPRGRLVIRRYRATRRATNGCEGIGQPENQQAARRVSGIHEGTQCPAGRLLAKRVLSRYEGHE